MTLPMPAIYFVRHATPDWSRTDLPYHVPPGPPLVPQGEQEAAQLSQFLRDMRVVRLYASPLARCQRTAELAGAGANIPMQIEPSLQEWQPGENAASVKTRLWPFWEHTLAESTALGPVAWVTHGGPIVVMLQALGLPPAEVERYKRLFDRGNALPPAGVWRALRYDPNTPWDLSLVFTPADFHSKKWLI